MKVRHLTANAALFALLLSSALWTGQAHAGRCGGGTVNEVVENIFGGETIGVKLNTDSTADQHADQRSGFNLVTRNGLIESNLPDTSFEALRAAIYLALAQDKTVQLWSDAGSCRKITSVTVRN